MKSFSYSAMILLCWIPIPAIAQDAIAQENANAFEGNWAMKMHNGDAGWLSIQKTDGQLQGQLWTVGQSKNIADMSLSNGKLTFVRNCKIGKPEFPGGPPTGANVPCQHEATIDGNSICVVMHYVQADNQTASITHTGKRMPPLPPKPDLNQVKFGGAMLLFNGKDLAGWRISNPEQKNGWKVVDGELINATPKLTFEPFSQYGNLRTEREFGDGKLNIDFKVPAGGNSGIYVRGCYEAQVVDRDSRMQGIQGVGAIFGRVAPSKNAGLAGDVWQSYEITIVDRHATVILNGEKVIDNEPIAGCTNGCFQADETIPGPLYLQGDHTAVSYRNIVFHPIIARPRQ